MDNVPGPFSFFINPEPITVKGIKTFNPRLFHIYTGKKGTLQFLPFAEKKAGCALGTIFKKATQLQMDKQWMGKVGYPRGIFRNDPNSMRTRNRKEMNADTIFEKLAYDLYQELGRGFFLIPKTRLSLQPILNPFNMMHGLAIHWSGNGITETLRIMSSYISGYSDFKKAMTWDQDKKVGFMDYLIKHHRPPTSILTEEGKSVPIHGLMALLAVGRCLADIDLLGGDAMNAGFVWIRKEGEIIRAQAVKIDPGYAFHFTHNHSQNASGNYVIDTHRKLGMSSYFLNDLRDLQTSTGNYDAVISWNALTKGQKEEFLSALLNCSRYLDIDAVLDLLFYREGKFHHSEVAYMPEDDAKRMHIEMKEWITWQLQIYSEDLSEFKKAYPEQLLRIKYIDDFGELPLPMSKETYPIRELFTDLMLINPELINSNKKLWLSEASQTQKELIHLEKLFEGNVKKILLIGNPGTGKSTLCQKIAHDWASGKLFAQFDGVYWLPLRYLNNIPILENSFEEFFSKAVALHLLNDLTLMPEIFRQIKSKPKRILFVLDGFDEAHTKLKERILTFFNSSNFHVILSSRPGISALIKAERLIENVGFSDQHIEIYAKRFFARQNKSEQSDLFLQLLSKNSVFSELAHNPLHLQMLCTISEKNLNKNVISSTRTELYEIMVNEILKWQSSYFGIDLRKETQLINYLAEKAFDGIMSKNFIIQEYDVENITVQDLLKTGFIKTLDGLTNYYFIHTTFQEYFAAYHLSHLPDEKLFSYLKYVWRDTSIGPFLCGIIYKKNPEKFSPFFNRLCECVPNVFFLFNCLNECNDFLGDIPALERVLDQHETHLPSISFRVLPLKHAFKWLISKRPKLLGENLFIRAIRFGNREFLDFLFKQLGGFNSIIGFCSLRVAVEAGKTELLDYLFEYLGGFNSIVGLYALRVAVDTGKLEVLEWLYSKDSHLVKTFDEEGGNLLHLASRNPHIKVMEWLYCKYPELISKFNNDGLTPLYIAAQEGQLNAVKFFISHDSSLIGKSLDNGVNLLHAAAFGGYVEVMQWLYEINQDLISKCTTEGVTPLHIAARKGRIQVMEWLCNKDLKLIRKSTKKGETPLDYAISEGQLEAIDWLCDKDPYLIKNTDNDGETPLHYAALKGNTQAMIRLCKKDPGLVRRFTNDGLNPLHYAVFAGKLAAAEWLCDNHSQLLKECDNKGKNALHVAALKGNKEVMIMLCNKDCGLIRRFTKEGMSALHLAAREGQLETIQWLYSQDPDLAKIGCNDGWTPLHVLAFKGHIEAMQWLIKQDQSLLYLRTHNGETAYEMAFNLESGTELLVSRGFQSGQGTCAIL